MNRRHEDPETIARLPRNDMEGEYRQIRYWPYTGCSPVVEWVTVYAPFIGVCGRIAQDDHGLVFLPPDGGQISLKGFSFAYALRYAENCALATRQAQPAAAPAVASTVAASTAAASTTADRPVGAHRRFSLVARLADLRNALAQRRPRIA